jgi:hypothetical protein
VPRIPRSRLAREGLDAWRMHQAGLTFTEIGLRMGVSKATAWRRNRWVEVAWPHVAIDLRWHELTGNKITRRGRVRYVRVYDLYEHRHTPVAAGATDPGDLSGPETPRSQGPVILGDPGQAGPSGSRGS